MNEIEELLNSIKRDLDRIETELFMNAEAIESMEMRLRFLSAEFDYEFDN